MTPAAEKQRAIALAKIERAQSLLYEAAQAACPLFPWAGQWDDIGNHADATKALWHRINSAELPERLDSEPRDAGLPVSPQTGGYVAKDLKRSTGREG
jgi:hypothetical protein